ncbi:MAG TPA: hypothetical protein PKC91_08825 [Ignavibacteria bacterium]|nr:hypothetical protein [Ignavibacteria bacterium]
MLKTSVLKIIQSFSDKEISDFEDFLKSPYHNKKTGVVKLYDEIKKYYPDFTNENLGNEKLWSKLYPGKKYGYGVMKNIIHDFTKLAEEFIAHRLYKSNELQEFTFLYKALAERELNTVLDNKAVYISKKFSDDTLKDIKMPVQEYYHHLTTIFDIKIWHDSFYDTELTYDNEQTHIEDYQISKMFIEAFVIYYSSYALSRNTKKEGGHINNAKEFLDNLINNDFDKILARIRKSSKNKYILLNSYYLAYIAHTNLNDAKYYYQLKDFLYSNVKSLPESALRDIEEIVDCISGISLDPEINKEKEFHEHMLFRHQNDIVLNRNGRLNSLVLIQWLYLFFLENKSSEMKVFVDQYQKYIIEDDDKNATLQFAEAIMLFMKSDYMKSLEVISRFKISSQILKNTVKKFTLMIYYELNDYEMFEYIYDSHMHLVRYSGWDKNSTTIFRYNRTKDFLSTIKKLFKLKEKSVVDEILLLEKEISGKSIDFKSWFIRKIEEIKFRDGIETAQGIQRAAL